MKFTDVRKWAKEQGFSVRKEEDNSINGASYYWANLENPNINGVSLSVSKLARDIFNHINSNKYVDHQIKYQSIHHFQFYDENCNWNICIIALLIQHLYKYDYKKDIYSINLLEFLFFLQ